MSDEIYEHGIAEGMRIAAMARCSDCAQGRELYFGFARAEGHSGIREWRHEAHHCRCGAWQIWDEMVRRGLLAEPDRWEEQPTHEVPDGPKERAE